ncbi:MAG: glycoside hydrolase family 43 protein [Nocardioidaceae bacterium]
MPGPIARLRVRLGARRLRTGSHPVPPLRAAYAEAEPLGEGLFVNPIGEGADPYVTRHDGAYLWCSTVADRGIAVSRSDRLTSLGERRVVWTPPEGTSWSREVWAPELIRLDGRWHIYFAASDGHNRNHRAYVLVARTDDPQGTYDLVGPLETGDSPGAPEWAIDLTVAEIGGGRYALWSGWPNAEDPAQHLYIAPMSDPTTISAPRTLLTNPYDYPWERIRDDGPEAINEGPQLLQRAGRTFVVYSCGSALLPSYKLGLLELVGPDPLDPSHWRKHPEPLFTSTAETFGVGHGTFVPSPDGTETWMVYHRKIVRERNFKRVLHAQPISWSAEGLPVLGAPVEAGVAQPEPNGTPTIRRGEGGRWGFTPGLPVTRDFDYYGHQQFISQDQEGLHLGQVPDEPVNAFRSGEKVVLRAARWTDVRVEVDVEIRGGHGSAGVLVRCTAPAVGVDSQRGYFAGWNRHGRRLVLGRTDGASWTVLANAELPQLTGRQRLVIEAVGPRITTRLSGIAEVAAQDTVFPEGSVGLRVAHAHAVFGDLSVERGMLDP